jgi:hypothetical protein
MVRLLSGLCILALAWGLTACTPLRPEERAVEASLTFSQLADDEAIPAAYGQLVSVTTDDTFPGWAQLWFEGDDGTVTTVFVKYVNGSLRQRVLVIPRA